MADAEIRSIRKFYRNNEVLRAVSFTALKGTCAGILGANGTGKSTLLNILAGVLRADGGEFLWQGKDLLKDPSLRSRTVGYVPQGTPLMAELNARDNLALWYDRDALERELEEGVLAMLGIGEFLKTPVYKMSGGMKKRLSIGCAVASNPEILLLDEPTAALDLICKERILNYFRDFKSRGGILILSTHDAQELEVCDSWHILRGGVLEPYGYDGNIHRLVGAL